MSEIQRRAAMSRKTIILSVLTAGISAAVLVFGVPHRHPVDSDQAALQNPVTAPVAGAPADSSKAGTEVQPAVSPADATPTTEPEPDVASGDSSEAEPDAVVPVAPAPVRAAVPRRIVVPAGTTLTVRIAEELGSKVSKAGQTFSATLDRDVVVGGRTVIAAGTGFTGKVAFAKHVGALAGDANLQLRLTSINVNNMDLAVVTSTRSFGSKIKGKNKVSRFMKGLLKRAVGREKEVVLDDQSVCSFTLQRRLRIQ
jgi:hypothetical protein